MERPALLPPGFLSTRGNQIISEATGQQVRIAAVNLIGVEVHGYPDLFASVPYTATLDDMKATGFNTIRLAYSEQALSDVAPPLPANPTLSGKTGQQIVDAVIDYAGTIGLKVILDHHRSSRGGSGNPGGLWNDPGYIVHGHGQTTRDWVDGWVSMAQRYAGNATVIGADLANEPFKATWGDGSATDWIIAATIAGNAILAVNPHWLIIVEGLYHEGREFDEYAQNMTGVAKHRVQLSVPGHVVYSPHNYPYSINGYAAGTASEKAATWTRLFGFIYQQNIAPLFVGEFGANSTPHDLAWLSAFTGYMNDPGGKPAGGQGISGAYWAWAQTSGATNDPDILNDDGKATIAPMVKAISPMFYYANSGANSGAKSGTPVRQP